jgi:hypothetical protein
VSALHVGIVRYASVATAIATALGAERAPEVRLGSGRLSITFRRLGATRWPETRQMEHALRTAEVARHTLAADSRRDVRERANRAIVIVYEDATLAAGCAVVARWECVVPAPASRDV